METNELHAFIIAAKAHTYIGSGAEAPPCRPGSHDLHFTRGEYHYIDSYFGGANFLGEEVVLYQGVPVWGMNYYGRLLRPERITAEQVGKVLKESLSLMYRQGRFLGGFTHQAELGEYHDSSQGAVEDFTGREWILVQGELAYELFYHGGLIR